MAATRALRQRTTARCNACGKVAEGVTTSQAKLRGWGQRLDDFHRCDACRTAVVERGLDEVLADYQRDGEPR